MSRASFARIRALALKEMADLRASTGVLVGPAAMLVTAVLMPLALAVGLPAWSGEPVDDTADLVRLARQFQVPGAAGLTDAALVQALLLHQFLPLMALVPVVGAMTLVTTAIVGEKQARTLEPLLATPLSAGELLAAKTGTAFALALALLAAGVVLLVAATALTAAPGVAATLLTGRVLALVGGVAPAAALAALTLGAIVSTRAKDARAAQQAGVVVVLPIVGGFVAQLNGATAFSTTDLLLATAGLLVLAAVLGRVAVHVFDRERILTQWT
jgi:ABC-2 type transport system permease protein